MITGTLIGVLILLLALTADRFGWAGVSALASGVAACWVGFIIGRWFNREGGE